MKDYSAVITVVVFALIFFALLTWNVVTKYKKLASKQTKRMNSQSQKEVTQKANGKVNAALASPEKIDAQNAKYLQDFIKWQNTKMLNPEFSDYPFGKFGY